MFIATVFEPQAAPAVVHPLLGDSAAPAWQPRLLEWLHAVAERKLEAGGFVCNRSRTLQGLKTGVADNAGCSTVLAQPSTGRRLTLKTSLWVAANRHGGAWLTVMCSVEGQSAAGRFTASEYLLERQLDDATRAAAELQPRLREIGEAATGQATRLSGKVDELLAA